MTATFTKSESLDQESDIIRPRTPVGAPVDTSTVQTTPKESCTIADSKTQRESAKVLLDWWSKYYASVEALEVKSASEQCTVIRYSLQKRKRADVAPKLYQKSKIVPTKGMKDWGKKLFNAKTDPFPTSQSSTKEDSELKSTDQSKKMIIATFQVTLLNPDFYFLYNSNFRFMIKN